MIHHFHIDHNAPWLPDKILQLLFPISPGHYSRPKRSQRQWLCKTLGSKQDALWSK